MFIKHKKDTILMTAKGEVWEQYHDKDNRNKRIGSIFENPELLKVPDGPIEMSVEDLPY